MPSQCYSSGLPFRPALKLGKFYFENTFSHARRYFFGVYAFGKTYVSAECGESSFPMQIGFSLFLDLHLGFRGQRQLVRASLDIQGFLLRSEEHTSELQSLTNLVCRLLLEKKKKKKKYSSKEKERNKNQEQKHNNNMTPNAL